MELWQTISDLFERHAPETLMALFGAGTSLLMFYLVWTLLKHLFGLQTRSVAQEVNQDQVTAALLTSLIEALLTEAGHLRQALDGILQETLQRGQRNAELLTALMAQTERTPTEVLALLKPELQHLHQAVYETDQRIVTRVASVAGLQYAEPGDESLSHVRDEERPGAVEGGV